MSSLNCANVPIVVVVALTIVVTLWIASTIREWKRTKGIALNRNPRDLVDDMLAKPISDFVWDFHTECMRVRVKLGMLTTHAAANSATEMDKHWAAVIGMLEKASPHATAEALKKHCLTREHPCQVLPSLMVM